MDWKVGIKFKQLSYQEFVTKFADMPKCRMMEKVDGNLGVLNYDEKMDDIYFQSTGGNEIKDLPVLEEYKAKFKTLGIKSIILAGELCAVQNGVIMPLNKTQSIVKTAYKIPAYKKLVHHYLFDVIAINGKKTSRDQAYKFVKSFKTSAHIHKPKIRIGDLDTFRVMFNEGIKKEGIEGVVIFDLKGNNYKVKEQNTVDLCVIGGGKIGEKAWVKNQVSYLLTAFIDKQGIYRSSARVGGGFTIPQREYFYNYLNDNQLYETNGEFFIKPKLIIEVKYFRIMLTNTKAYKFKNKQYIELGNKESIQFSHPSYMRLREDKKINTNDCRLEQIPEWGPSIKAPMGKWITKI